MVSMKKMLAKYVLLPGDPKRAEYIATLLENAQEISKHREFWVYSGQYKDVNVMVSSTGVGGPSTSIAVHRLAQAGIDTFIRVGTCGSTKSNIKVGDLIVAESAVRRDGTSLFYAPLEYPACASFEVMRALLEASMKLKYPCYMGKVVTTDSYYESGPLKDMYKNVLAFEQECSTLFVECSVKGLRSGAILTVDGHVGEAGALSRYIHKDPTLYKAIRKEIEIALEAVNIMERFKEIGTSEGLFGRWNIN